MKETEKAILVDNGRELWILPKVSGSQKTSFIESSFGAKSRIHGIRLRNNIFEIYVKESVVG